MVMWDALQFEGEKVVRPLLPHGQKKGFKAIKGTYLIEV